MMSEKPDCLPDINDFNDIEAAVAALGPKFRASVQAATGKPGMRAMPEPAFRRREVVVERRTIRR